MIEETLNIRTKDGEMGTFIRYPERKGSSPAVFLLMDAHGIREELKDMARRLAQSAITFYCPISITAPAATQSMARTFTRRAAPSTNACERSASR
jgi:dienelactone hydrolase